MSQILSDITLTLNTKSTVDLSGYPASHIGWIVFINASPYACRATVGSQVIPMPAWYYYPIFVDGRLTGGLSVTPYLQTIPGSGFTKTLSTILYEQHELPDNQSPQPLGGGPVDLTTATNILNTGNPIGTNIVFAQPLADGDPAGNVVITNSGLIEVGDTVNSGKILVSGTHVALAATNNIFPDEISILGTSNQKVDILVSGVDATITLSNQSGSSKVILQTASPGLDLSGLFSGGTGIKFPLTGTLTGWSKFTGTATITPTFFNHNLGVIPDIVLLQLNGTSSTAHDLWCDYASLTSTQAKITSDGTNGFVGLAIKF